MTKTTFRFVAAVLFGGMLFTTPAQAGFQDCGQPSSSGVKPVTSDAQAILRKAVGQVGTTCDAKVCVCDVNSAGGVTTTDALAVLRVAVGQVGVVLNCDCDVEPGLACTSAKITTQPGSDLDSGWTGLAHDSEVVIGASITARVKRECSGATPNVECEHDDDCTGNGTCVATCDCNGDKSCEVTGPTHEQKCLTTLADCVADKCILAGATTATSCETNADCGAGTCTGSAACATGIACVHTFGPPLPLASGGTPVCVITYFVSQLTGTANSGTGETLVAADLRSRIYLGNAGLEKPCPVCGSPDQDPKPGDVFNCVGGQFNNASCTVEGVSPDFGGTSSDCPPVPGTFNSSLAIRFQEVTTGTSTRTAELPCISFGFTANPSVPTNTCIRGTNPGGSCATNGDCGTGGTCNKPVCTDTKTACTSNQDCMRCTEETSTVCTGNGDCTGSGTCAEAPDQPVTCGYWCNCGLCGGDPLLPCFGDQDCPGETTCEVGPGTGSQLNAPQTKNNNCSGDKFICGGDGLTERCETTFQGTCSEAGYRTCETDDDCATFSAGICNIDRRQCFEPRITRTGDPSPLGKYCVFADKSCTTNADCPDSTDVDDFCIDDASRPTTVALFCVPTSASPAVNSAGGIMGPGAVTLKSLLEVCRCGDTAVGCDEECDDGNVTNGDGCDDLCQDE